MTTAELRHLFLCTCSTLSKSHVQLHPFDHFDLPYFLPFPSVFVLKKNTFKDAEERKYLYMGGDKNWLI